MVCATRGGPGSRACQLRAVHRARELGARLVFVHVVDLRAVDGVEERIRDAVRSELAWVGRALLNIAEQRARSVGVQSLSVLREGDTWAEVARVAAEQGADLLMVGSAPDRAGAAPAVPAGLAAALEGHDIALEVVRPERPEAGAGAGA